MCVLLSHYCIRVLFNETDKVLTIIFITKYACLRIIITYYYTLHILVYPLPFLFKSKKMDI